MRRGFGLACLLLFVVVLAGYGWALGRYFTSEDFLLVRFLGANPPWRDPALWTGPWLGISVVKFYRPVATLLYGAEIALFGAWPVGYNLVHTLVHALNAVMVFAIVRRLAPGVLIPVAVAGLFAIYPLHPNAVLFGASFATLFGAGFLLAGFLTYQRFRETGAWRWLSASLGLFLLALLSYEAAAILPGLLAAYDVLLGRRDERWKGWLALLPFFGVLGLYFVARRAIFGVFVGGYDEYSARLLDFPWRVWLKDLATSIQTLHAPAFDRWPTLPESLVFAGLVTVVPFVFLALARRRTGAGSLRLWLFAWAWILITQVPFAFRPCVPGNGRYWYVTAAGVAMAAAFVVRGIAEAVPGRARFVRVAVLGGIALYWGWLLAGYLQIYVDAGRTARTIQGELIREHAAAGAPPRIFVTRYPYFLVNAAHVPVAQVFHYGLRDAVNPPFVSASVPVYPLTPLRDVDLLPIFAADPRAVILEWDASAGKLRRAVAPVPPATTTEIPVLAPADGAILDPSKLGVHLAAGDARRFRMIVVAHGNATTVDPAVTPAPGGAIQLALPNELVTTMARLYPGGEFLWWLEARDASGALAGWSRMRSFHLGTSAARP
jgi:hypothetical protein